MNFDSTMHKLYIYYCACVCVCVCVPTNCILYVYYCASITPDAAAAATAAAVTLASSCCITNNMYMQQQQRFAPTQQTLLRHRTDIKFISYYINTSNTSYMKIYES